MSLAVAARVAARVAAVVMAAVVGEGREQPGAVQVAAVVDAAGQGQERDGSGRYQGESLDPDRFVGHWVVLLMAALTRTGFGPIRATVTR